MPWRRNMQGHKCHCGNKNSSNKGDGYCKEHQVVCSNGHPDWVHYPKEGCDVRKKAKAGEESQKRKEAEKKEKAEEKAKEKKAFKKTTKERKKGGRKDKDGDGNAQPVQ